MQVHDFCLVQRPPNQPKHKVKYSHNVKGLLQHFTHSQVREQRPTQGLLSSVSMMSCLHIFCQRRIRVSLFRRAALHIQVRENLRVTAHSREAFDSASFIAERRWSEVIRLCKCVESTLAHRADLSARYFPLKKFCTVVSLQGSVTFTSQCVKRGA